MFLFDFLFGKAKKASRSSPDSAPRLDRVPSSKAAVAGIHHDPLYVYLEHLLAGDSISLQLMHEFRNEMDDIGRAVIGFLNQYEEIGLHPEMAGRFAADFAAIGEALVARIRREEDMLYPMYAPPAQEPPSVAPPRSVQGRRTLDPVVLRAARSICARAASFSG